MHGPRSERELSVALVQPSIPQTLIWDPKEANNRFKQLLRLSELALRSKPDLLVWPEAALPNTDQEMYRAITNLVVSHNVWMIFGADDVQTVVQSPQVVDTKYFNSSFLLNPKGEVAGIYRKRRLVIFGEYVPLSRWLPFMKYLTPISGGFTPGDRPVPFRLSKPRATASVLICFEDVFPHLTRTSVDDETDFILNLTNNGWFGESAAQWQHAAAAVFRAIENGVPLVRCANNGLTCWVDPEGGMHDVYFPGTTDIYGVGFKIVEVPLSGRQKLSPTFYHQHGDWFGWGCLGLSAVVIFRQLRQQRRHTIATV